MASKKKKKVVKKIVKVVKKVVKRKKELGAKAGAKVTNGEAKDEDKVSSGPRFNPKHVWLELVSPALNFALLERS